MLHHPNSALPSRAFWSGGISTHRVTLSHSQRPTRSCPPHEAHESCRPHDTTSTPRSRVLLLSATRLPPSSPLLRTAPRSPEASLSHHSCPYPSPSHLLLIPCHSSTKATASWRQSPCTGTSLPCPPFQGRLLFSNKLADWGLRTCCASSYLGSLLPFEIQLIVTSLRPAPLQPDLPSPPRPPLSHSTPCHFQQ